MVLKLVYWQIDVMQHFLHNCLKIEVISGSLIKKMKFTFACNFLTLGRSVIKNAASAIFFMVIERNFFKQKKKNLSYS